jgi:hypothetical protein
VVALPCLTYESQTAVLTGTIKRHTFAGPPNYESIAKGDAPEVTWVLHLAKPICMTADKDSEAERNVSDLQLVFEEGQKQYERYRPLVGRKVNVTGTLFHALTGHHHTRVLLTVREINKQSGTK